MQLMAGIVILIDHNVSSKGYHNGCTNAKDMLLLTNDKLNKQYEATIALLLTTRQIICILS